MSIRAVASIADFASVLAYAGAVVAGVGALVGSFVTTRGRRHEAKASAADMLTEAAERVSRLNVRLDRENRELRRNLMHTVDCVEDHLGGRISKDEMTQCIREIRERYG